MKKKMVVLCAALSVTLPSFATPRRPIAISSSTVGALHAEPVVDPSLVPRVWSEARAYRAQTKSARRAVHTNAITDSRSARAFVIPAAGSLVGGGGTLFFRSDVTLINYNAAPQDVVVIWWPVGTSNLPTQPLENVVGVTIPARQAVTVTDFVTTTLKKSGLGAILFLPVKGNVFDDTAALDGLSRIYTKQPGSNGTVSQEFPPVDPDSLSTLDEAASLGLRHDSGFRTNYGVVNFDDVPHVVHVRAIGERATNEFDVTVAPGQMIQNPIPAADYGALTLVFTITDAGNNFVSWIAYGSSTDNITGDGWVSLASADFDGTALDDNGF